MTCRLSSVLPGRCHLSGQRTVRGEHAVALSVIHFSITGQPPRLFCLLQMRKETPRRIMPTPRSWLRVHAAAGRRRCTPSTTPTTSAPATMPVSASNRSETGSPPGSASAK